MNKVVTIHLCGAAFQLEEAGYDALRLYLDEAARRLQANPDKDEIIADIEQAIADKCRAVLGAHKNVVLTREIERIVEEMGPVQDVTPEDHEPAADTATPPSPDAASAAGQAPPRVRRLYKIHDGAMFAGVCNGLGVYFGIDPTIVRLLFVVLTFFWGFAILVYLILMFILPSPETPAEKAAAYGVAATAQEFIRRAREGYYEGLKTRGDRRAHREWRRRYRHEMRGWGRRLNAEALESAWRAHEQWWQRHWSPSRPGVPPPPGMLLILPVLAVLRAALVVVAVFALLSLLTSHAVFGLALPAGLPVWVALIVLVVAYSLVAWPLKAMRHARYWHTPVPPLFWFGDTIIVLGSLVVLFWLVDRHVPQAHEALQALPAALHHAAETVRHWWSTGH